MSISFSGLASGLDTTSWVESLVALKRAKVTTLQEEKEELLVSKDTLSSIKNFFNSFRSTIERITDSRFNIVSMDLFAQNIATSANLSVLTATASSEAEEGSYKVKVDKLASSTTATSNYKKTTTTTVTATATEDTLLTNIGVKTGNIGVTVNGIKHGIAITEKDTIGTFIDKLENIGVEASFNKNTGVFSMNISAGDIDDDIDNDGNNDTEIVEKLHLAGVNEGYKTQNKLEVEKVETVWKEASASTKLIDLGVKAGTITIEANDSLYDVTIDDTTTIEEFVQALNDNNINATYDETTGIFTLNDAEITNEGDTEIIRAFGLQSTVYSKSQVSGNLSLETVVTTTTTADSSTELKNIGDGTSITNGDTVIVKNSNNKYTTITVGETTTIGGLLAEISNAGLYAAINNDGTVEISGGVIEGGSFDAVNALGLSTKPFTAMTTGNPLTENVIEYKVVDYDTKLCEDLGVLDGYLEVTDADGNIDYLAIHTGQSIGDLMTDLSNFGIATSLDTETGVLSITGGAFRTLTDSEVADLIANNTIAPIGGVTSRGTNLLECLYGSDVISTDQISVSSTYSRTRALTTSVTNLQNADLNTTLEQLGLTTEGTAIFDSHGSEITIDITKDMTIQALREKLSDNGISTEWDAVNSKLTINNATLVGGTSDLGDILNLTEVISGKYVNSDAIYTTTYQTIFAEPSTPLTELGLKIDNNMVYTSYTIDGTIDASGVSGTVIGIGSATDLQNLAKLVNEGDTMSGKTFVLTNDIDLSGIEDWVAIGANSARFKGKFDGQGYTISNLNINRTITASATGTEKYAALFGKIETATIKNLTIKNANISVQSDEYTNARVAVLAGWARDSSIENVNIENANIYNQNCCFTGTIASLVQEGITLRNTTTSGIITSFNTTGDTAYHAGGMIGRMDGTTSRTTLIDNCQNHVNITLDADGYNYAGGIIGMIRGTGTINISNTLNKGNVTATNYASGFIGGIENYTTSSWNVNINNSINTGELNSSYKSDFVNIGVASSSVASSTEIDIKNCFGSNNTTATAIYTNIGATNSTYWDNAFMLTDTTGSEYNLSIEQISNRATTAGYDTSKWALTPTNINLKMASEEVILHKEDGTTYTLNVDSATTLQDLVDQINYYGVTASISGGKFQIENGYITNEALENALGLETKITGESVVLGTQLTHTITEGATGESTLGEIIETLGATAESKVAGGYNLSFKGTTLTVDENTTLNNLFEQISNAGGRAFLDSTGRIHIEGGTLTGSVAEALGFTTQNITTAVSASGETITMTATVVADSTSRVGDFINIYNIDGEITVDGVTGTIIGISTAEELALLATHVNNGSSMAGKTFVLTDDIDLSGYENWTPIGNSDYNNCWFTGTFDGNGHTISNLNQEAHQDRNATNNNYIGLFGVAVNATIKNLKLDNVNIEDNDIANYIYAGALLGVGSNITLENIEVNNLNMQLTTSNGYIGGVAGRILNDSHFNNIKADGTIVQTGSAGAVGGLFGELYLISDAVQYCYSSVDITANSSYAGGIAAGLSTNNTIAAQYCSNSGTIHNNNWNTGGIFGLLNLNTTATTTTNVEDCYNLGSLSSVDLTTPVADIFTRCNITTGIINVTNCGGLYGEAYKATNGTTISVTEFKSELNDINDATVADPEHWKHEIVNGFLSPIPTKADIYIRNTSGDIIGRIENVEDMTFEELFNNLNAYGINASFDNGIITMTSENGNYITGVAAEALGITTTSTTETTTIGMTNTSSVPITYTQTVFADETKTLDEIGAFTYFQAPITKMSETEAIAAGFEWVTTAEELRAAILNNKNIMLGADIDMTGVTWGSYNYSNARLDGNGYSIKNLSGSYSLFNNIDLVTIQNLGIESFNIESSSSAGIALKSQRTSIDNCYITDSNFRGNSDGAGGFVAGASNTDISLSNIFNSTIVGRRTSGGFIFTAEGPVSVNYSNIYNCQITSGIFAAGGIIGATLADIPIEFSITGCSVIGAINGSSNLGNAIGFTYTTSDLYSIEDFTYKTNIDTLGTNPDSGPITGTNVVRDNSLGILAVNDYIGNQIGTISVNPNTTLSEIFTELSAYGITASMNNGVISLTSADGNYITGSIAEALGIEVVETTATVTGGKTYQSTTAVTFTETSVVDTTTKLEDLKHMSEAQAVAQGYTWVTNRTDLWNALNTSNENTKIMLGCDIDLAGEEWAQLENDFQGEFNGNYYTIKNLTQTNVYYSGLFNKVKNATIKNVNIDGANITETSYSGILISRTSYNTQVNIENCTVTNSSIQGYSDGDANIGGIIGVVAGKVTIDNTSVSNCSITGKQASGFIGSISSTSNTEVYINNSKLHYGNIINGNLSGGVVGYNNSDLYIKNTEIYIDSDVDGIISCNTRNVTLENVTYEDAYGVGKLYGLLFSGTRTETNVNPGEIDPNSDIYNLIEIYNSNNEVIATHKFDNNATVGDVFSTLAGYGISGSINNGVITLDSTNGNYIKGNVAEALGIGTQEITVTTTVGTTATSTASIIYTEEVVADYNSKVSEYLNRYEIDGKIDAYGVTGSVIGISTAEELALLATLVNNGNSMVDKTFVLTNDIDLSGYENWTPIGNQADLYQFKGTFDGNGHTISNLTQTQLATDQYDNGLGGLFGIVVDATIKNLKLDNVNIVDTDDSNTYYHIGALLAYGTGVTVENIEVTNLNIDVNVTDEYGTVGGVAGTLKKSSSKYSTVTNVKVSGTINQTGNVNTVGGVVGNIQTDNTLSYLYSDVTITSESTTYVGGIAGGINTKNSNIAQYCASRGYIEGDTIVGGLFGFLGVGTAVASATIDTCYAASALTGAMTGEMFSQCTSQSVLVVIKDCGGFDSAAPQYYTCDGAVRTSGTYYTTSFNQYTGAVLSMEHWENGVPKPADIIIRDSSGNVRGTYDNVENMTFTELFEYLSLDGITATMSNGVISIESERGYYVTGSVWEALGFEEIITTTTTTTTTPIQITSTAAVTYIATTTVTGSETLGTVENKYGTVFGTLTSTSITGTIIKISTAQDLVNLASAVNSGASTFLKKFVLTNDINMSSISDFAGIGNETYTFQGTFDGQGYTISNLKMSETITASGTTGYAGLFNFATDATFKNVTISGAAINLQNNYTSTSSGRVGTLVGHGWGNTYDGITIKNTNISIGGGNTSVGGLCGTAHGNDTIKNCSTTGTISGAGSEVGGLVGWAYANTKGNIIDNCVNSIQITGNGQCGGIIGLLSMSNANSVASITNCLNKGNVTSNTYDASGIIGRVNTSEQSFSLNISDSINLGSITATYESQKANIIALIINNGATPTGTQSITINNCFAGEPSATNTDQIYHSDSYYSTIVDTTGSEVGLTWDNICQKAQSAGYDTTKWSLNNLTINLKAGDNYDIWICDENGVIQQTLDYNASTTLNSIYNTIKSHGTASFVNGQLAFAPNTDITIDGGGERFLNTTFTKTATVTMTSDTTFKELGVATSYWWTTIKNTTTGAQQVITIRPETTVGDYMNMLSAFGFNCIIDQGKLVINSTNKEFYISDAESTLETALKIDFAQNKSYTVTTSTTTTYTSSTESDRLVDDFRYFMDSDTTFGDLGCPEGASKTMTVYSNGETHTISVTSSKTLGDFMTELASYGITTEISEDGKFIFKANNDAYVKTMAIEIAQYLKFYDIPRETIVSTTYANTTSASTLQTETTSTLNSSTTFSNLGITGAKELKVISNGSMYTVTVNPDQTLGDLMTTLAGYGIACSINDGKLVLQGNSENFVNSIDTDLSNVLQVEALEYGSSTRTIRTNTTSDEFKSTEQRTLSSSTTIGSLHEGETWYSQYIYLTRPDGIQTRFEVYDSDTIDDIITQLAGYGIRCDIHDGYFSINHEASNSYIIDMNPELKDALGLRNTFYTATVTTTTTNDNSNKLSATTTTTATGATKLEDLRNENGHSPADYQINLTTESQEGSFNTVLTFNTTDTLHDVIDKLAEYGINATIDSAGRFDISSNTLTDFEISGGLGEFLMSDSYIKNYQESSVSNTSTILPAQTEEFMNDSTILGELGIYSGDVVVYKNGEKFTISVSTPQSVGNFRAQLGEYGISSSIIEGKLQLIANGVVYLETPDSNASNLVEVMGLGQDKWTKGDYSQKSDDLSVVNSINATATLDSKIKDLTDENGNPLGITNGQIYVYQDGVRNIIDINTNDTLRTLADKLKNYGITVGISQDGHLYFDGNNNSYLTTEGLTSDVASNILTKFNISGEWDTRYDSVSEKLDYESESESIADGSTKLVDLQDEDGNSLGITTGTYYVYQNGVRNTETITSDTTVNDFRATMASYGLTTDFNENGELSVGGYNETYIATSALAGDNTNAIDVLFEQWNFVNVYTSNGLDVPENVTVGISETTKLADINEGTYQAGYITVVKDGVKTNIELTENDTVGDLIDELALYGFESVINSNGQLIIKNTGNSTLEEYSGAGQKSNALDLLDIGLSKWINTNTYEGSPLSIIQTRTDTVSATRETLLSDLNLGITTGEYYIYNNGVKYTALISSDETIGSLMDTLASFGIQANLVDNGTNSVISIIGNGDSYVAKSNSTTNASNVVEKLFVAGSGTSYNYTSNAQLLEGSVTSTVTATETTLLSVYDDIANNKKAEGDLVINIDGYDNIVQITANDTLGSLVSKLQGIGLNAMLADGNIIIESGYKEITITTATTSGSGLLDTINLKFEDDLGGYVSSNATVIDTQTIIEDKTLSVANYANDGTEMKLLNISSGSLTVYRNGEKATIQVDENQTFGDLNSLISSRFSDVKLGFEDGYLRIYSDSDDVSVEVGSTTDTSNFSAITGIASDGNGDTKSSRELYCVNSNSVITTSGLFRNGDVTEGTFKIGDATFEITNTTRLSDLISQINASQDANATAYWDSIDGKFVIQSRTTGAALINIEADSSNFTDIMGLTTSGMEDTDGDGTDDKFITRINTETQKIGDNAKFSINGTYYTSTKNEIGSDVSRINGLTINLKGISEGETTITVERDKETVANAVSDVVDAYNELIENIDKEIAKGQPLADQSTLKLIRNQIRSVMTGALVGASTFKNLDAIGISIEKASANNINTTNINVLNFDKDKFIKAFDADRDALKTLLVGTESNNGIFQQVENIIEQAVTTGYFTSAERSYNNQISRLDSKIEKAQKAVERYKEQLEAKFASMDLLISKMQNQYSSFLGL